MWIKVRTQTQTGVLKGTATALYVYITFVKVMRFTHAALTFCPAPLASAEALEPAQLLFWPSPQDTAAEVHCETASSFCGEIAHSLSPPDGVLLARDGADSTAGFRPSRNKMAVYNCAATQALEFFSQLALNWIIDRG